MFVLLLLLLLFSSKPGPEVKKLFSCSTQLSMNFFLLINIKMPTIVGISEQQILSLKSRPYLEK